MENQDYAAAVHNAYAQCVEELERKKAQFLKNRNYSVAGRKSGKSEICRKFAKNSHT